MNNHKLNQIINDLNDFAGSKVALLCAIASIGVWLSTGPFLQWSDTWQLLANTVTTLITFVMGFIIQNSTKREFKAIHLKLDAIAHVLKDLDDRPLIGIELKDEEKIEEVKQQILDQ